MSKQSFGMLLGFLVGVGCTLALTPSAASPSQAPAPPQLEPAYRGLDAALYMNSAEYHASCHQAFAWAKKLLQTKVEKAEKNGKPLAVVADLDETIVDNSGFQTMQTKRNLGFDKPLWDIWQGKLHTEVKLVPGAAEFVRAASDMKVSLVYISNRDETYRTQTKECLQRLGIGISDEKQLKLATDTSNKDKRRAEAREQFQVLLYVGDNLRDFDDVFRTTKLEDKKIEMLKAAIAERHKKVEERRAMFGEEWILLPNAVYGEWTVPSTKTREDVELLPATAGEWK
jgi:5'-nucleotidase (lipoprotein e(P4) family)